MTGIKLCGTGGFQPENRVENSRFSELVETSDEWIRTRTGIESRALADGDTVWSMGLSAAKDALSSARTLPEELDLIIVSTVTPDWASPSLSCVLQGMLGAKNALCLDLNCACAGFIYALDMARRYLNFPDIKTVLVIASEMLSRITNYADRSTCVLFGDGAGACVVRAADTLYGSYLGADGTGRAIIYADNPQSRNPFTTGATQENPISNTAEIEPYLHMDGRETYKFASRVLPEALCAACERAELVVGALDWIVPHQANIRIVQTAMKTLGLPMERAYMNIDHTGNTSSASIPLALNELVRAGKLLPGQKLGLAGFGAGLIYGAAVMEWS